MGRIAGALLCVGVLALVLVGIGNVSCYSPPNPTCGFLCNINNSYACPSDYSCSMASGVCVSNGAPTGTRCFADAAPSPEGIDGDPTPPMVLSTSPHDGDVNVDPSLPLEIVFSQVVLPINTTTVQILDGANQISYAFALNTTQVILTPSSALPGGHVIVVKLSGLKNATPLEVPLADYSFSFTTLDNIAPALVLSLPMPNTTNISTTAPIILTFSEPVAGVDATSFAVTQGATAIGGTITSNTDATQWTLTPTAALPAASLITVTLSAGIHDLASNPLGPVAFSFTTQ